MEPLEGSVVTKENQKTEKNKILKTMVLQGVDSANCKNGNILPTGQWYAPSAGIKDAWYCMVLHGIA